MLYLPSRIFFGENALTEAEPYLIKLGNKPLIVTGKSSAKLSGALDELIPILKKAEQDYAIFDRVQENPSWDIVREGARFLKDAQCDYLIAIGGGSPIDAAKAMALIAANNLFEEENLTPNKFSQTLPLVAIPTTAGTGSEVTQYSVLTDTSTGIKAGFGTELAFPTLAICNPRYTLSLNATITLHTAIDALSHLLEGIFSNKRQLLLYPLIQAGIEAIMKNLEIALNSPNNLQARTKLMQAALYGGITIAQTGTTLQHSLGYPLTTHFGISHGLSNAIVLRQVMELYYPYIKEELDNLFSNLNITREDFENWLDRFPLKAEFDLSEEFIESHIAEVLASRNMANTPIKVKEEDIRKIYKSLK
ncbi:MAG TPA: iron-containing alcohol dehydrogenase [Candidatus Syntrophosphaera thermopropionivorans]|nr:iron-containing alcohol dehydrogenase [Candidatus Syntrophosphaera thermopropionivorans]